MNFFCLFLFKCLQWGVWLFILVIAFGNEIAQTKPLC